MADAVISRDAAIAAFLEGTPWAGARQTSVAGDASSRRYFRLNRGGGDSVILMDAPPDRGEDTAPFIAIADHLRSAGFSAPDILAAETRAGLLLIEDFGDALFAKLISSNPQREETLYTLACDVLIALRRAPKMQLPTCDAAWLTEMIEPLFEWYCTAASATLAADIRTALMPLAQEATEGDSVIMLRDYHVENLLLLEGRAGVAAAGLLDFQDAMLGPPAYDLVSILQDARRDVPEDLERQMRAHYLAESGDPIAEFDRHYAVLGLQRNLRILGIFARLSLRDGKPQYLRHVQRVWGYVQRNLRHPDLAPLRPLIAQLPAPTPDHLKWLGAS